MQGGTDPRTVRVESQSLHPGRFRLELGQHGLYIRDSLVPIILLSTIEYEIPRRTVRRWYQFRQVVVVVPLLYCGYLQQKMVNEKSDSFRGAQS